ncbi:cytochrome b/b6 domain-containing protein [Burkholderia thailandensis]|uniref:Prokaryotic cytochrome b561 family protein n=1 Tax=Burkholderia thailandensis TaxID=57975 RepID=A0AAW9CLG9_BURTH|nr:cytochrome b/b6 domain-containing protein [Burkholderia thailandensis]AIP65270.1 cytochrome B561 [Burkholderia thailandensis]AOI55861.1 cytochrome B [Burkholderia thailandensis]MCS3394584.1 cytochrome b/b6 domain-containing protein [Burkholderia thailandensis]MCS6427660.1 cytochrome b/b6 domain-containing protein [Burkholderia thailandensis]MCS6455896.1 cytochrome b/b6 domain-containing protein [Burkholderia thailandensis]
MNNSSASPAEGQPDQSRPARILVWDAPIRVFHWLMVVSFVGAWLTAESERWRLMHVAFGYTMLGLVLFRVVWGVVGTRHARFSSFVRPPATVIRYLASLAQGRPEHYAGHNPAGAVAIVVMLAMTIITGATGWTAYTGYGESFGDFHEGAANAMLALVAVHVAAVLISSVAHCENLAGAMVTGYRRGMPIDGIRRAWWGVAAVMTAAVIGWWWTQWRAAPQHTPTDRPVATQNDRHESRVGRDDD